MMPADHARPVNRCQIAGQHVSGVVSVDLGDGRHAELTDLVGPVVYRKDIIELSGDYLADYETERVSIDLSPEERARQQALGDAAATGDRPARGPAAAAGEPDRGAPSGECARNAALRAMFHADPHFRRSEGQDVGVDEVHQIEGSPTGRQRKILQARALGLLDDELLDQEPPPDPPSQPRGGQ